MRGRGDHRPGTADTAPSFDSAGVGYVVKALAPKVEVICVQPLGALALTHSWRQRHLVTTDSTDTIADGVAG